jgi:hypothetical protein
MWAASCNRQGDQESDRALTINKDPDKLGVLKGVTMFNSHLHLPHDALTTKDSKSIHRLARQPIDLSRPHPFTAAGNREFNSCI